MRLIVTSTNQSPEGINAFPPDKRRGIRKWGLGISPFTGTDWASDSHLRSTAKQVGVHKDFTLALTAVWMAVIPSNFRKVASLGY